MDNNLDLSSLSVADIVEEYKILHKRHQQLKECREQDAQRIHDLKRSLDRSLAAESFLAQELEQLNMQAQDACPSSESRLQQELEELRRKYKSLQLEQETLQQDYAEQAEEMCCLKAKLHHFERDLESSAPQKANGAQNESLNRLTALELENGELMHKLAEYQDAKVEQTFVVAEREKTIEILRDQVECLEENLRSKRDELEEKLQLLESSQEQLVDANAKIALLTSAPETNDRKGNSLFAEVDDQRQVMKNLLASQKKSYLHMKQVYNDSKSEINRLKRENIAMHTELQACSTIFCSADRTYQNKLNERIRQLLQQNVMLEGKLNVTQERLRDLASEKSITWLDSMLDFCKRETDELKTQLHSVHLQMATLEEQMRRVQQEMARWRFESLKSRCVLIDRENLLTENNIAFKRIQVMEFDIKKAELQAALPRIVSVAATGTSVSNSPSVTAATDVIVLDTPLKAPTKSATLATDVIILDTPLKVESSTTVQHVSPTVPMKLKQETIEQPDAIIEEQQMECKIEAVETETLEQLELAAKPVLGIIKVKTEQQLMPVEIESKKQKTTKRPMAAHPNRKGTPVKLTQFKVEFTEDDELTPAKPQRKGTPVKFKSDPFEHESNAQAKPLRKGTPVSCKFFTEDKGNCNMRSILTKRRDIFAENTHNVKFSSIDPIVHNLSPDICSPAHCSKENEKPIDQDIKPPKKTQGIIRRVVVASKKATASALK